MEDKEWRKIVSNDILSVIHNKVDKLFNDIHLLGGAFLSKAPGKKGQLPLHQDWNIVDEKKTRSYNLWIPLMDVNEFNGSMRILPASHQKQETYRGPNLPPILFKISDVVEQHMISLEMKAGEVLLYDHALWHSSPVNQSAELRLAAVFGVVPRNSDLFFYHRNENHIEEYVSFPEFFFQNDPKDGPKGLELNKSFSFEYKILNEDQFFKIYLGRDNMLKPMNRFLSLFNLRK